MPLQICIELTTDGPVEVSDNCSTSSGQNNTGMGEETPMVALKILMDREENPSEYNLEDEWDRQNHYPENEHDHYLHDHEHYGEDGFFCNPVGMSTKENWFPFFKGMRMKYIVCVYGPSFRQYTHSKKSKKIYLFIYTYMCVYIHMCKHMHLYLQLHLHLHIQHVYVRACMHACMCGWVHVCKQKQDQDFN